MAKIKIKRERVKFASDNVAGACPEVLEAIIKANEGDSAPYGNDPLSTELQDKFSEIWTVGSSGTLSRGLQKAFPELEVHVISVGHKMSEREIGRAKFYKSPYKFDKPIKPIEAPPFPSAPTYDAKAWPFLKEFAKPNALFWNVGK